MKFLIAVLVGAFAVAVSADVSCHTVYDCLSASAKGQAVASMGCSAGTCQGCNSAAGFVDDGTGHCGCSSIFDLNGKPRISWNSGSIMCMDYNKCEVGHDYQCNNQLDRTTGYCGEAGCVCYPGFTDMCVQEKRQVTCVGNQDCGCADGWVSWQNGWPYCVTSADGCFADYECGKQAFCSGAVMGAVGTATPGTCMCHSGWNSWASNAGCTCPNTFPDGSVRVDWTSMTCLAENACVVGEDWQCKNFGGGMHATCNAGWCSCNTGFSNNAASGDYINCVASP